MIPRRHFLAGLLALPFMPGRDKPLAGEEPVPTYKGIPIEHISELDTAQVYGEGGGLMANPHGFSIDDNGKMTRY